MPSMPIAAPSPHPEHPARVAAKARLLMDSLQGLTAGESLEVLGVMAGLTLARVQPGQRPMGHAMLRERCLSALAAATRHQAPGASCDR
jgi:hypothetical protein